MVLIRLVIEFIMLKNPILIIFLSLIISCEVNDPNTVHIPNPKVIELHDRALKMTILDGHGHGYMNIDSAIILLDEATRIDSLFMPGYINKCQFFLIKKDYKRLLETNAKIRILKPHQPLWIIQKGFILELSGKKKKADIEYKKAIKKYEEIIENESNIPWEFKLDYASSLVWSGDYNKANDIIISLKKEYPDLNIWKSFKLPTKKELLTSLKKSSIN